MSSPRDPEGVALADSESVDDEQLTIRIPNPKAYLQRQTLWVGRRGKPRCDHCRTNNLKCDRTLPFCNHCSWSNNKTCTYTPLPTPAHRGIPRCDRCRLKNIKCDRNLPVCNNCNEEADGPACNYTPKRRSRMQDPASGALNDAKSKPWLKIAAKAESTGHTFYGHNIASSRTKSNSPDGSETISDLDTATHTGRFSADIARPSRVPATDYLHFGAIPARPAPPSVEFIPHPFSSNQQVVVNAAHINPWPHLNLAPLPSFMLRCLHQVDGIEMPKRADFDNQLATFIQGLMEELRETACIPGDTYARVCQALAAGNLSTISERLKMWVNTHHVTLGSDQMDILLLPHETLYSLPATESPPYKRRVVADLLDPNKDEVAMKEHLYDRFPVQEQLYEVLTYAHRAHAGATEMVNEIARLRFASVTWPMAEMYVRLCPFCEMRGKSNKPHDNKSSGVSS